MVSHHCQITPWRWSSASAAAPCSLFCVLITHAWFPITVRLPLGAVQPLVPMDITWPIQATVFFAVNELFLPDLAGEVLAFGARAQSKLLLPVMGNTIKSELATQHVTPGQHFLVMTTAGKQRCFCIAVSLRQVTKAMAHFCTTKFCLQGLYICSAYWTLTLLLYQLARHSMLFGCCQRKLGLTDCCMHSA